jgi:hypothetical protein
VFRRIALSALAITMLCSALPALAQEETTASADTIEGVITGAQRQFYASGSRLTGTAYIEFGVFEFDTEENAERGMPEMAEGILEAISAANLRPTSAPHVRDSAVAYTGQVAFEEYTVDLAVLVFRDGRYVHVWFAFGPAADPFTDLTTIATQFFQDADGSSEPANLLDRLPALDDLPPGFVLDKEVADLMNMPAATPTS